MRKVCPTCKGKRTVKETYDYGLFTRTIDMICVTCLAYGYIEVDDDKAKNMVINQKEKNGTSSK